MVAEEPKSFPKPEDIAAILALGEPEREEFIETLQTWRELGALLETTIEYSDTNRATLGKNTPKIKKILEKTVGALKALNFTTLPTKSFQMLDAQIMPLTQRLLTMQELIVEFTIYGLRQKIAEERKRRTGKSQPHTAQKPPEKIDGVFVQRIPASPRFDRRFTDQTLETPWAPKKPRRNEEDEE